MNEETHTPAREPAVSTSGATPANPNILTRLRGAIFGVAPVEASFARRGFPAATPERRRRLESIGETFLLGYNHAVRTPDFGCLTEALRRVPHAMRGFAYEGAGMGLAVLDIAAPFRSDAMRRFAAGPGAAHIYMIYVGAGLALARTSPRLTWRLGALDPLLQGLMWDGYGFHEGFFHPRRAIEARERPRRFGEHKARNFDQGLGRALWFATGAAPAAVAETIGRFPTGRQADLWSGIGLASTYAGGVSRAELETLRDLSGGHLPHLRQGASFAAAARARAGNTVPETELACAVHCGMTPDRCATIAEDSKPTMDRPDGGETYTHWRAAIRDVFAGTPRNETGVNGT